MAISPESKMKTPDRVLTIEPLDGQKVKSASGMIDPRLFDGTNKLHAVMDPVTCLWHFKYEMGSIPEGLRGEFTGFSAAKKFASEYFHKRNIKITEVQQT